MTENPIELIATVCFALALIHTFSAHLFTKLAERFPEGSVGENIFHLLGEVEVVFGLWAAIYLVIHAFMAGPAPTVAYLNQLSFTEPAFVFVILVVCSTAPILYCAEWLIDSISRLIPLKRSVAFYFVLFTVGPLLGSFITEPAAMAVTAMVLVHRFFSKNMSSKFMYATLGLLFVNISIGGTLTPFAAPPVLMVAPVWGWDTEFMLRHFGWRGALSCLLSTSLIVAIFYKELASISWNPRRVSSNVPPWLTLLHLAFLGAVVVSAHYMVVFIGVFLFFLALVDVTKEFQNPLKLRDGLLVAFFLGGLVIIGQPQRWWLEPILRSLGPDALFWGTAGLTAFTDNAALTYLGAQVPNLSDLAKQALVAGAVVGGGLTVVANAPNPAGYGILNPSFKDGGISAVKLLLGALLPTLVASVCFWLI